MHPFWVSQVVGYDCHAAKATEFAPTSIYPHLSIHYHIGTSLRFATQTKSTLHISDVSALPPLSESTRLGFSGDRNSTQHSVNIMNCDMPDLVPGRYFIARTIRLKVIN